MFEELLKLTPAAFQSIARVAVSSLAEGNARARESDTVEDPDMVKAFLEGTPGPFQGEMRESLKQYGFEIQE
jgi:hypothetical protein